MSYYNQYNRSNLINHIYSTLPFEEFVKWDFSNAWEIINQYQILLKKCFENTEHQYLWNLNIKEYITNELAELLKQKEELEWKKKIVEEKLNEFKKIGNNLKNEFKSDEKWQTVWKKFSEMNFDTWEFEDFLYQLERKNPENYKLRKETIVKFLNSENYKKTKEWIADNNLWTLKSERNTITRKLNHKSNSMSIERQIYDIKKWKAAAQLSKNIEDDVKKYFWKKNEFYHEDEDHRDMQTIYMETLTSRIILNKKTDDKFRSELIKRYSDNFWLWKHVWDIYLELITKKNDIRKNLATENNKEINFEEEMIKLLIQEIDYWIKFCKGNYHMLWQGFDENDISYLEEKIKWEKKQSRNMEVLKDEKLYKIFRFLRDYLEHNELENQFEMMWNYSYRWIEMDANNMKKILSDLFKYMDKEDKEIIREWHKDRNAFKDIEERIPEKNNQLELW